MKTLKYCKNHFKTTQVIKKGGFFLKALQDGYFKDEINVEIKKKEKQVQQQEINQTQKAEAEKLAVEKQQKVLALRGEYQNPEFITSVLAELNKGFMFDLAEKDRNQGKVNAYLQGVLDKKLLEQFG